jgi:class 3 adenylate cyclase
VGTETAQVLEDWSRFLPGALVEWGGPAGQAWAEPPREAQVGALMITDISGFTRLTVKLSRENGQAGAEKIGLVLNGFVAKLVATVERLGGTILNFEGDSLVAGWKSEPGDVSDLGKAVWTSCHCALALQREVGHTTIEDETLSLRSGVAAGTTYLVHLLSRSANRRIILAGPGLSEVSWCATLAESGEILVSPQAWSYVGNHAQGRPMEAGPVHLIDVEEPPPSRPSRSMLPHRSNYSDLISYLPVVVRSRIGLALPRWLAELRTVTTAFIRITGPDLLENFMLLEQAVDLLEAKITRFDGDLLRVVAFEHGLQALVVFGLPGKAHQDDPRRASLAGLELHTAINPLGLRLSIGVATGDAFCGAIGTERRAEYTVLGESVNRAARLSALAAGRTLVDDITAAACANFVDFQGPWSMQLAGIRTPIPSFIALRARHETASVAREELVGRSEELRRLTTFLLEESRSEPRTIAVVGEPGIGKSALMQAFARACKVEGVNILDGFTDDIERNTPYFAFRPIIKRLLGIEHVHGPEAWEAIQARIANRPEQIAFIPLLNDFLDIGVKGPSTSLELPTSARSERLRRLLKELVLDGLNDRPTVLLIEDVHWLDAASWDLLFEIIRTGKSIRVALTSRTKELNAPVSGKLGFVEYLELHALGEADTTKLVSLCLNQLDIPDWLQRAIWDRTEGNPFFVGEICQMMKQRRPETWARVVPNPEALTESTVTLPQSARAAVLSRTDALLPDEQFVLKIASAIGVSFSVSGLEEIEIIHNAGINSADCVTSLAGANLIKEVSGNASLYTFTHAIIRDVVYASMLSEQKREAHAAIARAMEQNGQLAEAETLPLILNQWQRAQERSKVFEYLDRVAELRLRQFDNNSAIKHIASFLKIAEAKDIPVSLDRLAAAHFMRADAQLNLGQIQAAREGYETGLRLIGLRVPSSPVGLWFKLAWQITEHLVRSRRADIFFDGAKEGRISPVSGAIMVRAARAHESLTEIFYFMGDKGRLVYATLRATNLAERFAKPSPVLVVNYASLGAICGVVPLRKRARRYLEVARTLSEQIENPAVGIRVGLLSGLYETSVAQWQAAKTLFKPALEQAEAIGDTRSWCELAVCMETILSPWLLNPAYEGEEIWGELVEKICRTARTNGDMQVLGCGLTAGLRGARVLGTAARGEYLDELATLLREHRASLEAIHALEGAAILADQALDCENASASQHWLEQMSISITEVNPTVKSRTLPALCAAFATAMRHRNEPESARIKLLCRRLADRSAKALRQFARIYLIGRPRSLLFAGDLHARFGNFPDAAHPWRQALIAGLELQMPADALAAIIRLRRAGFVRKEDEQIESRLSALLSGDAILRGTAERAAGALYFTGGPDYTI